MWTRAPKLLGSDAMLGLAEVHVAHQVCLSALDSIQVRSAAVKGIYGVVIPMSPDNISVVVSVNCAIIGSPHTIIVREVGTAADEICIREIGIA